METNNNFIDDLLVKYLLKETNSTEDEQVEQWLHTAPENKRYFNDLRRIWENSTQHLTDIPVEEEAWIRFKQRVQKKEKQQHTLFNLSVKRWISAAAILLIALSGGWLWYESSHTSSLSTIASESRVVTDTLSDQTIVTLNKKATLQYPLRFRGKERAVWLSGEAFFDVSKNKKQPFVVHTHDITITVLGTAFNIKNENGSTVVIVARGTVKVSGKKNSVLLHANEKAVDKDGFLEKEPVTSKLYNYYVTRAFICNNTPLSELVRTLNEAYNTRIIITNPKVESLPITSTFHSDQPLDSILNIITQTFNGVSYYQKGDKIIIR